MGRNVQTIKMYFKISAVVLSVFLILPACKRHADPRYTEAEALSDNWCIQTQMELSDMKPDSRHYIQMKTFDSYQGLMTTYPKYDNASATPITIVSYTSKMYNSRVMTAPEVISKESMCKLVAVENLSANMPDALNAGAADGTCREMNQEALDWALDQLTPLERARYKAFGKKLTFADDIITTGSVFYGVCSDYDNKTYALSSVAQMLPYTNNDPKTGSHYCKLISPAQALFWVLERAYWRDPVSKGPEKSDNASLECDIQKPAQDCMLQNADIYGSCIFYLATAGQNMCLDYTGKNYANGGAKANCDNATRRVNGKFSTDSCATRTDLYSGTGFESYKGVCVLACGNENKEYRFNIYNDPSMGTLEGNCPPPNMWYPAAD